MIPKNITREHLLAAITQIDESGVPRRQNSTIYDLEYLGGYYPPKLVVRKANFIANGEELLDFGGGAETNNFLISRGFNIITRDNMTDLSSALRAVFPNIWRCAESGKWALIQETSVLSFDWLDPNRNYRQQPATEGGGKKSINPWVNELKAGDLIFVLDKYRFYGIAIAESEYDPKGPFLGFDDAKHPAIQVQFLYKVTEDAIYQFSEMRRPSTFSRIDSSGFSLDKTLEILRNHVPGAIDALSSYLEKSEGISIDNPMNKLTQFPLNQILYGPPGTGKTFNTINKALEIIGETDLNWDDRKAVKRRFDDRVKEGRIVFTTFHQSMSYEDFIEGIKPMKPDPNGGRLGYEIKKGIFQMICEKASQKTEIRNFDDIYEQFVDDVEEAGELDLRTPTQSKPFRIVINSSRNPVAIPRTEAETRMVVTREMILNYLADGTIRDWKPYTVSISNYIRSKYSLEQKERDNSTLPFVLIIDEINRGNISQIFGELITLIEPDKRLGKDEALTVTLPYSKEPFGVPPNLYIIGTMNTADRSVESLDTALRRRFSFEEIPPKPEMVSPNSLFWRLLKQYEEVPWKDKEYQAKEKNLLDFLGATKAIWDIREDTWDQYIEDKHKKEIEFSGYEFKGTNLATILTIINGRIEKLLDPDHQIGHSYFMDVTSMEDLQEVFYHKVIPLLQEYFFGDYGKIGLVLGRGFVRKKKWDDKNSDGFADFGDYENAGDFNDREVFEIVKYHHQPAPEYALKVGESTYKMDFEKAIKILLNRPIE